tara:strand:+ start:53 stop:619 length:567 start_codon:yes stop_codon:yes gene_type:complete
MTIEFNGIEELMWCSAKIKKEDLLNKDQNFLTSTAETLMSENSFRLFSTGINHQVDISGTSVKVNFQKPEIPILNLQKNEFQMNVYEILENSRVYSDQNIDPSNLEMKINTNQDQSLFIQGYEVFNETECKFLQNGKQIDLTLESESSGNIQFKLLYLKDDKEFFAFDLEDIKDIEEVLSQVKNYLKN